MPDVRLYSVLSYSPKPLMTSRHYDQIYGPGNEYCKPGMYMTCLRYLYSNKSSLSERVLRYSEVGASESPADENKFCAYSPVLYSYS